MSLGTIITEEKIVVRMLLVLALLLWQVNAFTLQSNVPTSTVKSYSRWNRPPQCSWAGLLSQSPIQRFTESGTHYSCFKTATLLSSSDEDQEPLHGPIPPNVEPWKPRDEERLFAELHALRTPFNENGMRPTEALLVGCMAEVCNPILTPVKNKENRAAFWLPYRDSEKDISQFFREWLHYAPEPDGPLGPAYYITQWDYLANTKDGLKLTNEDEPFKRWFVKFLDLCGRWINSPESVVSLSQWMTFQGDKEHPFNITDYVVPNPDAPDGGFQSFNQFFLRPIKRSLRPVDKEFSIVSPCDGAAFYLQKETMDIKNPLKAIRSHKTFTLQEKSADAFNLGEALPGYGDAFVGGSLVDLLLWFSDYHWFHSPVDGKVIHASEFAGSYNYDFDDFDPNDPHAPAPPDGSDRAGWYKSLCKHKRYSWIIKTKDMGLVAMVAIGFWGVGSITPIAGIGDELEKGQNMGHFGYGGSSIILAFEPQKSIDLTVNGKSLQGPDKPTLVKICQGIGNVKP